MGLGDLRGASQELRLKGGGTVTVQPDTLYATASRDQHFRCPLEHGHLKCHQHVSNVLLRVQRHNTDSSNNLGRPTVCLSNAIGACRMTTGACHWPTVAVDSLVCLPLAHCACVGALWHDCATVYKYPG
jgi:hypothetical protein